MKKSKKTKSVKTKSKKTLKKILTVNETEPGPVPPGDPDDE